jgi:hypothetical protein
MWRAVAAYGGERYLHQVAVPCASKVLDLCYKSDIQYCVKLLFVSMQLTFYMLRRNKKSNMGGLCQTNNKHVCYGGMKRKLRWDIRSEVYF